MTSSLEFAKLSVCLSGEHNVMYFIDKSGCDKCSNETFSHVHLLVNVLSFEMYVYIYTHTHTHFIYIFG